MASQIPEDLLIDILARLPVKTLLRFMSVCKYWYALIENHDFIANHQSRNPSTFLVLRYISKRDILINPDPGRFSDRFVCDKYGFDIVTKDKHHTLAFNRQFTPFHRFDFGTSEAEKNCNNDPYKYINAIRTHGREDAATHKEFAFTMFRQIPQPDVALPHEDIIDDIVEITGRVYYWHDIIGPVNGIFLLYNDCAYAEYYNKLALWNPVTTELRILPLPDCNFLIPGRFRYKFGLGVDPSTNYYKVIWIPDYFRPINGKMPEPPNVALYSLATNTWRVFNSVLPYVAEIFTPNSTYLSGTCFWVSHRVFQVNNDTQPIKESRLVAFDISMEVFREIKVPNPLARSRNIRQGIKLVFHKDESIALFVYDYDTSGTDYFLDNIDIWVMNHAEEGCWSKLYSFGLDPRLQLGMSLGFWKNGDNNEMFFTTRKTSKLVSYNTDTGEILHLGVQGDPNPHPHRYMTYSLPIFKYKESLVSFGGRKCCKFNDLVRDFLAFRSISLPF